MSDEAGKYLVTIVDMAREECRELVRSSFAPGPCQARSLMNMQLWIRCRMTQW